MPPTSRNTAIHRHAPRKSHSLKSGSQKAVDNSRLLTLIFAAKLYRTVSPMGPLLDNGREDIDFDATLRRMQEVVYMVLPFDCPPLNVLRDMTRRRVLYLMIPYTYKTPLQLEGERGVIRW